MAPQEKSRINNLAVGAFAVLKQGNHIKGPRLLLYFLCFIRSLLLRPLVCYSSHFYFYWGWSKPETLLILPWLKKYLTNVFCLGILVLKKYMALQLHKPENHYSSLKLFLYSRKSIHTSNHDAAVGQYV